MILSKSNAHDFEWQIDFNVAICIFDKHLSNFNRKFLKYVVFNQLLIFFFTCFSITSFQTLFAMRIIIMNYHLIINLSSLLFEKFFLFEMIYLTFLTFHSTNSIIFQFSLVFFQTMHFFSIHKRNSRRHRNLSIHHINWMTIITDKLKRLNITFESFVAFKMCFEKIINAIKIILFKWCIY